MYQFLRFKVYNRLLKREIKVFVKLIFCNIFYVPINFLQRSLKLIKLNIANNIRFSDIPRVNLFIYIFFSLIKPNQVRNIINMYLERHRELKFNM